MRQISIALAVVGLAYAAQGAAIPATVFAWGDNRYGQTAVPRDLSNVVSIAAGYWHTLALTADGRVAAWGRNDHGQTDVPADLTNVIAIAALESGSMALRGDGTVVVWGSNTNGQTNVPLDITNVVAIAGGRNHCLALRGDGTVRGWGDNQQHQLDMREEFNDAIAISAADDSSMILRRDRVLYVTGTFEGIRTHSDAYYGIQMMGRVGQDSLLLYTNGVLLRRHNPWEQTNITVGLSNLIQFSGGPTHALFLDRSGKIAIVGDNLKGQCHLPEDLGGVLAVAAGAEHSVVIATQSVRPFIFMNPSASERRKDFGLRFASARVLNRSPTNGLKTVRLYRTGPIRLCSCLLFNQRALAPFTWSSPICTAA